MGYNILIAADKHFLVCSSVFLSLYEFPACSSCDVSSGPASEDSGSCQDSLPQILAVAAYSKGFACSPSPGVVVLFEKTKEKEVYKESQEIWVERKSLSKQLCSRGLFGGAGVLLIQLLIMISSPSLNYMISIS